MGKLATHSQYFPIIFKRWLDILNSCVEIVFDESLMVLPCILFCLGSIFSYTSLGICLSHFNFITITSIREKHIMSNKRDNCVCACACACTRVCVIQKATRQFAFYSFIPLLFSMFLRIKIFPFYFIPLFLPRRKRVRYV